MSDLPIPLLPTLLDMVGGQCKEGWLVRWCSKPGHHHPGKQGDHGLSQVAGKGDIEEGTELTTVYEVEENKKVVGICHKATGHGAYIDMR